LLLSLGRLKGPTRVCIAWVTIISRWMWVHRRNGDGVTASNPLDAHLRGTRLVLGWLIQSSWYKECFTSRCAFQSPFALHLVIGKSRARRTVCVVAPRPSWQPSRQPARQPRDAYGSLLKRFAMHACWLWLFLMLLLSRKPNKVPPCLLFPLLSSLPPSLPRRRQTNSVKGVPAFILREKLWGIADQIRLMICKHGK